jgi:hypothetical protein
MLKYLIFVCLVCSVKFTLGQATFHKVYALGDPSVFFNSVIEKDSFFLVSGSSGKGLQRMNATFLKLYKNGETIENFMINESNFLNVLGNSFTSIDTNIYGDYLFHYISVPLTGLNLYKPTVTKYNVDNNTFTVKHFDTLSNGGFDYLNMPRLLMKNSDSIYYINSHYDLANPSNQLPDNNGFFIIKLSQISDSILWIKRFTYSLTNPDLPTRIKSNILGYENGNVLIVSLLLYNHPLANQEYSKIVFYTIDESGNIVQTEILQDTQYSRTMFGSSFLNNQRDLLICYSNSEMLTNSTGQPYWGLTPSVARLDSNFQIIWKKNLGGVLYNPNQLGSSRMINKFVNISDTAFVGAYFRSEWIDSSADISSDFVRIENRHLTNGELNWKRNYWFYPEGSMTYNPSYEIRDAEPTNDGGFIFVGEIKVLDSLIVGSPGQLGYILKTNCLGFLDDPQAGFSATTTTDSLAVNFQNTSLMGGSFQWSFGDGTILNSVENVDSVFHIYSDSGTYQVQLIAYGCNGANDTITPTIVVSKSAPVEVANPNITNYMAVGPNPVKSGESIAVYVGNLPSTSAVLSFYDYQGKLLMERAIGQENSTYIMVLPFSSGLYQAVLKNGKDVLEVEKILIY